MHNAIEISDKNFDEMVLKAPKGEIVVVDFWADWCMPCKMLTPVMEKLAAKYKGKVKIAKLNVDANPIQSTRFGITGIPAVKMFKDGKVIDEFVGFVPEPLLDEWIGKRAK